MTVLDDINFFGASPALEMEVEEQIAYTIAEPTDAVSATFRAFGHWERAYIADINGNHDEAVSRTEECLEATNEARAAWKRAERAQSELISTLATLPNDAAVRPEVRHEFEHLRGSEHINRLKEDGLFPEISVADEDSMLDLASELLPLEPLTKGQDTVADGDEAWSEIIKLFRMDQRMQLKIKKSLKEFEATVRECQEDVEQGQLFEANQYETHRGSGTYPVARGAQRVRANVMSYLAFKEAYGTFMTEATIAAPDELFDETIEFVADADELTAVDTDISPTRSDLIDPKPADD